MIPEETAGSAEDLGLTEDLAGTGAANDPEPAKAEPDKGGGAQPMQEDAKGSAST